MAKGMTSTTTTSTNPLRVAVYARVSTSEQNAAMQVEELRQVGRQRGWNIVAEFVDEGFSGTKRDRPALDEMLDAARRGKFDLLAVWKLDRLGRSLQHLIQILDELHHVGVGFVSVRDGAVDTSSSNPQATLMLHILGAFAAYEAAMIRERVVAGVRRAQANGTHCGRPVVEVDLRPAVSMLEAGYGLKAISKSLDISRATLRRRLEDAGEWPRAALVTLPGSTPHPTH